MRNIVFNNFRTQHGYDDITKKIMSLKHGETFVENYYQSRLMLNRDYQTGRNKAIIHAIEDGYIESISIGLDLFGNEIEGIFKRL